MARGRRRKHAREKHEPNTITIKCSTCDNNVTVNKRHKNKKSKCYICRGWKSQKRAA